MYALVQNLLQQLQEQTVRLTQLNEQLQQEIARRQQIEASLQESEARFQATFEQVAVGMAHVGVEGQFLRVNQKLCEMLGYTREELLKQTFQAITHPDYLDAELNYTRQLLAGEIKTYSMEKCYIRKDGTLLWANLMVSLVQAVSREPQYFVILAIDVSTTHNELRLCQQVEATLQFQQKFERLVASISTRFINLPSQAIPEEINQALRDIGEFMQVDTSYIFRISGDRQTFSMTYEWTVPGLAPQIQNLQNVPNWIFPWAFDKLQQGEIVYVPSVANLPEEAAIERTNWQSLTLQSVIFVPLVYQNTVLG
ncbi:MAG TPA: PAS domain S-box protein, partial [Coleofasciculaceae cyanobacterium]